MADPSGGSHRTPARPEGAFPGPLKLHLPTAPAGSLVPERNVNPTSLAFRQVHLDFHTSERVPGVGRAFDGEAFARTLEEARVNSVTCFSKCHHGMIYHETRFPARHPCLEVDLLAEQIRACRARGIRVPVYISVGLDEYMAREHPEWIEVSADGRLRGAPLEARWRKLCLNSPYVDYVVEQTAEVLERFDVDGLFFDILHQGPCCCRWCLDGMREAGVDPEDEAARLRFARGVLDRLRLQMTKQVHAARPGCSVFWNSGHVDPSLRPVLSAFTHLELESLPSGGWGYDHFPLTVRYARNLGLDHLGMTGKFHKTWAGFGEYKNQAALEYECFTSLAEGSKVSIGDQLPPSGELHPATYELIGAVYRQVEEREPWCRGARALTEVAVLHPAAVGAAEGRVDPSAAGAYRMLLEDHLQFDLVDAEMDWSRYRVLVLPDKIRLDPDLAARVRSYLASGGAVLASHCSGLAADRDEFVLPELGVDYEGEARFSPDYLVPGEALAEGVIRAEHVMYDRGLEVAVRAGGQVLAEVWWPYFNRTWEHFCSHRHTPVERPSGKAAVVGGRQTVYFVHPVFRGYSQHGVRTYKLLVLNALRRLLPDRDRLVLTDAPSTAHVTLLRQDEENRTVAHLLHYIPEQRAREIQTIEEAIPLREVSLSVRLEARPSRVYAAPARKFLPFQWADGRALVTVPEIRGHQMVVFE